LFILLYDFALYLYLALTIVNSSFLIIMFLMYYFWCGKYKRTKEISAVNNIAELGKPFTPLLSSRFSPLHPLAIGDFETGILSLRTEPLFGPLDDATSGVRGKRVPGFAFSMDRGVFMSDARRGEEYTRSGGQLNDELGAMKYNVAALLMIEVAEGGHQAWTSSVVRSVEVGFAASLGT
jgi:hypothetical protein